MELSDPTFPSLETGKSGKSRRMPVVRSRVIGHPIAQGTIHPQTEHLSQAGVCPENPGGFCDQQSRERLHREESLLFQLQQHSPDPNFQESVGLPQISFQARLCQENVHQGICLCV